MTRPSFLDSKVASDPLRRRLRRLTRSERAEEAGAFLDLFLREGHCTAAEHSARSRVVRGELARHGFYRHTPDELAFGARVAWRNHGRCIGRLFWKSLEVLDCRALEAPDDVATQTFRHLADAFDGGQIRPVISVFAPMEGDQLPVWIESRQASQYAGYVDADGVVGDPANIEITRTVTALGWTPPQRPGHFDLLPLLVRDRQGRRQAYALPDGAVREVEITHPQFPAIGALGLRWYAVPLVCDMVLSIGGLEYPCAPFNGWYMATEIASRNLIDPYRYDRLDAVASAIAADRTDPLWKDHAVLELNRALLTSYAAQRVTLADHHLASAQYMEFDRTERANGRLPSADWAWIVPPQGSALCPVFHQPMADFHDVPNFYRTRTGDGASLHVSRATEEPAPLARRAERIKRRLRNWRRQRD